MNKNRIEGAAKQALGTTKEVAGRILGEPALVAEGQTQIVEGQIQSALAKAAAKIKAALKS